MKLRFSPILLALAAGVCAAAACLGSVPGVAAEARNPAGVAVIIGNRNYTGTGEVRFAHRDAAAFRSYVLDVLGFDPANVIHLEDATQAQMVGVFGNEQDPRGKLWFYLDPDEGRKVSDVVVFYSGHGMPELSERTPGAYLLPTDASPSNPRLNGYSVETLYRNLAKLPARSVSVFVDACFTGRGGDGRALLKASPVIQRAALPESVAHNMTILTAAKHDQLAYWDEKAGHGMFTHHLLDALYGGADADRNGEVAASEVERYLKRHMRRAVRRTYQNDQVATLLDGTGRGAAVLASTVGGGFPKRPLLRLEGTPEAVSDAAPALDRGKRLLVQRGLDSLKFDPGPVDGAFGPRTREAIASWQKEKGYRATGRLTEAQAAILISVGEDARPAAGAPVEVAVGSYPEPRGRQEGTVFRDCPDCPEMVVVPAGGFQMGSPGDEEGRDDDEGPAHGVTISRPFAVGRYEVTRSEFGRFVSATGRNMSGGCTVWTGKEWKTESGRSWRSPGFGQTGRDPVVCVNWNDAKAYVKWLSGKTGKVYRLLSESEWEYAARGRTSSSRYWGDGVSGQCGHANGADEVLKGRYAGWKWPMAPCRDGHVHTSPAGSFAANAFGLYDVLGNAWEWVEDCWNKSYDGAPRDGSVWLAGNCGARVLRGGSWFNFPQFLRAANRVTEGSGYRNTLLGFRVARTLTP